MVSFMPKMETNKIKRIVVWGLWNKYHTNRHIHKAFYDHAKKLGYEALWVEDEKKSAAGLRPGDLVIYTQAIGKMVPEKFTFEDYNLPVRDDILYCLHNIKDVFKNKLNPENYINLQVYRDDLLPTGETVERWGEATYFDKKTKTLYQPWGTDLLPEEFKAPVFNENSTVYWIGSVWNDKNNHGNIEAISELREALKKKGLKFRQLRFIPDFLNRFFIRKSRIAPAIAGKYQVEVNYLPCRMFKNISYGQLGITNVKKFKDILGDSFIEGNTIKELISKALSLSKEEYISKVKAQQEIIKNYTYKNSLENIIRALEDQKHD